MPTIRRRLAPRAFAALALLLLARPAAATDVTDVLARMRRAIEPGRDMRASFELVMTNAQGERVRWGGQFYRLGGLQAKKRLVFDSPVDLRGVSVSVQRTDGARDRTRIYLPFVRRVREIESDMRGESFLGTDFNFEDLGLEELEFHEHALRGIPSRQDKTVGRAGPDAGAEQLGTLRLDGVRLQRRQRRRLARAAPLRTHRGYHREHDDQERHCRPHLRSIAIPNP